MPRQPLARSGFLLCCFSFFVLLPQSLHAQAVVEKPLQGPIKRFVTKLLRGVDKKTATGADKKYSPELLRWLRETDLRNKQGVSRVETESEVKDDLRNVWELTEESVRKRAQSKTAELEAELAVEAERIKEEENLTEKCEKSVASALKEALCSYLTGRVRSGSWPKGEASNWFAMGSLHGALECASSRMEYRVSQVPNRIVAKRFPPAMKVVGKVLGDSFRDKEPLSSKPSEEEDDGFLLGVIRLLCHEK